MEIQRWNQPGQSGWSALDRLSSLRDELDSLFGDPFGLGRASRSFNSWAPCVDLYEQADGFTVRVELPGMKKEDIEVSVHDGMLSVSGERKSQEHKEAEPYRSERFFGKFTRSVSIPAPVQVDQIKAVYKDGILTVTLPKAEEARPRQIQVDVS
jgi:HSP20 family protein